MPNPAESWLELPDGRSFWLRGRCSIGRQTDNDVVIDVPELSRHHALISADGGGYLLSDLHSRSDLGEEITGSAVNVLYRSEKIAKGFGASSMVSQAVVDTLSLGDGCESYGRSSIDGMSD